MKKATLYICKCKACILNVHAHVYLAKSLNDVYNLLYLMNAILIFLIIVDVCIPDADTICVSKHFVQ